MTVAYPRLISLAKKRVRLRTAVRHAREAIWAYDGGIGHGAAWPNPLEPGATAVINLQSGRGSGTAPADDVQVVVVVNSAEMAGCRYKPSQQWPTFQRLSQ